MTDGIHSDATLLQSCPDCAALLDVSEEEPFANVICPVCGTSMRTRTNFNNFTLQMQIGVGGMGAVYKALDVSLNRMVALKVVLKEYSSDPAYLAKFEHEARMAAMLNHPHVVKVYSFGSDHGLFYIAMELVDHGSMEEKMTREGSLPESLVLEVGIQVAEGLQAAYQKGLIHRDVKPGNILFADDHTAKIVDFGLALPMAHAAGKVLEGGEVWGTPYYIAPEKLSYQPEDFRSDIYSLGASLFHALAGRPSFEGETNSFTELLRLKSAPVNLQEAAPHVSNATAFTINRTLNIDPEERFQSYEELIEHLNYARTKLRGGPVNPDFTGTQPMPARPERPGLTSLPMQIVAAGIMVLAILFFSARGWLGGKQSESAQRGEGGKFTSSHATAEQKYLDARMHLLRGDYSGAQKMFHDLGSADKLPHPLDRWVMLHEGLSMLLGGHLQEAQALFSRLEQDGVFSAAPEDRTLANFFVNTGRLIAIAKPVPPQDAMQFSPENCEAFGVFIFALADREMSDFDESEQLFQAFLAADPKSPYEWVRDYKPLARKNVADFEDYKKIAAEIKDADTLEKKTKALEDLHAFNTGSRVSGKFVEMLQHVEVDLKTGISAGEEQRRIAQQAEEQRKTEQHARDAKLLESARAKYLQCLPGYLFQDGLEAIEKTQITDSAIGAEKEILLKKAQWLVAFKQTLITDVNTLGYPKPISRLRTGSPIAGGVRIATQTRLEIQTQYGTLFVDWNEIPPSEILAMAAYFTARAAAPDVAADRQWLSGVFAKETGMSREGNALLQKASEGKAAYADLMRLFTATPGP
jgi:hypothetical protein